MGVGEFFEKAADLSAVFGAGVNEGISRIFEPNFGRQNSAELKLINNAVENARRKRDELQGPAQRLADYVNGYDQPFIAGQDNWRALGHHGIYDLLQTSVNPGLLTEIGVGWSALGDGIREDAETFMRQLTAHIYSGWRGKAADLASGAPEQVNSWGWQAGAATSLVGNRMQQAGMAAEQARNAIAPPPKEISWWDRLAGSSLSLPLSFPDAHTGFERSRAAEEAAIRTMEAIYTPTYMDADTAMPTMAIPADPTAIVEGGAERSTGLTGPVVSGGWTGQERSGLGQRTGMTPSHQASAWSASGRETTPAPPAQQDQSWTAQDQRYRQVDSEQLQSPHYQNQYQQGMERIPLAPQGFQQSDVGETQSFMDYGIKSPNEIGSGSQNNYLRPDSRETTSWAVPGGFANGSFTPGRFGSGQFESAGTRFSPGAGGRFDDAEVGHGTQGKPNPLPAEEKVTTYSKPNALRAHGQDIAHNPLLGLPSGFYRAEEDRQHRAPRYLVDPFNFHEILGELPKVAPPVIGENRLDR